MHTRSHAKTFTQSGTYVDVGAWYIENTQLVLPDAVGMPSWGVWVDPHGS